jgi:two-component system cell cycle sensor histidine kinase/response regulator CckA
MNMGLEYTFSIFNLITCIFAFYYYWRLLSVLKRIAYIKLTFTGLAVFVSVAFAFMLQTFGVIDTSIKAYLLLVWFGGLGFTIYGMSIRGLKAIRVYSRRLPELILSSSDKYHYLGIGILSLVALPTLAYAIFGEESFERFYLIHLACSGLGFTALGLGGRILYCTSRSRPEEDRRGFLLFTEDATTGLLSHFMNIFLSSIRRTIGQDLILECVAEQFENNPMIFEGCQIEKDGSLDWTPITDNLTRINKQDRSRVLLRCFQHLIEKLVEKSTQLTSHSYVDELLRQSYGLIKEQYRDLPELMDVLRSIPEGFVKEERLALLTKQELEYRVRERTEELEQITHRLRQSNVLLQREVAQREKAEEALREAHDRLITILDSIDADIYVADLKTYEILFMNKHMKDSFGDGRIGDKCWKAFRAESGPCSSCTNEKLLDDRGAPTGVCTWEGQNPLTGRSYINYDRAIRWTNGKFVRLQIATDISELKQTEVALRQSEERYKSVVEGSIQGILIHQDSVIRFLNNAAARMFGYAGPDELIGREIWNLISPEHHTEIEHRISRIVKGEIIRDSHEWEGLHKNGTRIWIQSSASTITLQGQSAILAFFIDITERKRAEEALLESERRYRSLVQNLPTAIYRNTPGPEGEFLMANPAFLNMFGFDSEEEVKKVAVSDLYSDPSDRNLISNTLLALGSIEDVEIPLRKKDGTPIWGSVSATAVRNPDGEVNWFDCTILDITAQKNAEEEKEKLEAQLHQAQKMEAIGTLAGGIAHDFNNLLMGIQGNTSLILIDVEDTSPHFDRLRRIEELVQSGSKLTRQLLGYARKGKYVVNPIDLNEVVSEVSETFRRTRKDIVTKLDLGRDLFAIEADKSQIEQVLFNLYVNAADAMPSGGDLTVRTRNTPHENLMNKPYNIKSGKYVLLTVADTGIGMDDVTIERLFEPFFTTKEMGRGTGLGLASVYGIVKAHGGYIDVESKKGRGSTFSVYLPASEREVKESSTNTERPINGNETILVVDDEEFVLDLGLKLLKSLGYRTLGASSGIEALKIYESNKDEIDLIILDMVMPEMGGGEAFDRLRKLNPEVPVLLCSGYSIDGQAREIMKRGCNGFIQKPFTLSEISNKLRQVIEKK